MTAPGMRADSTPSVYQEPPCAHRDITGHCRNVIIPCPDRYQQPATPPVPPCPARPPDQPAANRTPRPVNQPPSSPNEDDTRSVSPGAARAPVWTSAHQPGS